MYAPFPETLFHILFPVLQWLHVVAAMLIVGGTLFYEFVVPHALDDLREEQQLAVLGKVRWWFRSVVLWGTVLLIVTGVAFLWRLRWSTFHTSVMDPAHVAWWWVGHVGLGMVTLIYALILTFSNRVPPMSRMRVNFVLLLVVVFLASAARHIRLAGRERKMWDENHRTWTTPTANAPQPARVEEG